MAVLKKIKFGTDGAATPIAQTVVTAASGSALSVNGTNTGLDDDANPSYAVDLNIDGTTLKKVTEGEGTSAVTKLAVGEVPAEQVSVANHAGIKAANAQDAFKELKDAIDKVNSDAKSYTIVKVTSDLESNVKEQYKLQETIGENSEFVGEPINIYKDSSLKSVALNDQSLVFTYILADGSEDIVSVDVSKFLAESEFADGLQVNDHVVSAKLGQGLEFGDETGENKSIKVKVDSTSENFLTVGADGVKLAGVQDAINAAKAAATTKVEKASNASHLIVLQSDPAADGSVTYTIGESDIASKAALDAEIAARKAVDGQDGQTYAANSSANYIKDATSLNDADVKLDAAIKAVSDKTDAIQYKVTGTTLEFFGIKPKIGIIE